MIDLGKAVVSNDEKAIKSATGSLVKRAIAAVVIFFIPTMVGAIFNIVSGFGDVKDSYKDCAKCVTHPGSCDTSGDVGNDTSDDVGKS